MMVIQRKMDELENVKHMRIIFASDPSTLYTLDRRRGISKRTLTKEEATAMKSHDPTHTQD